MAEQAGNSDLILENREKLTVTGVRRVLQCNAESAAIETARGVLQLAVRMRQEGRSGSLVTLLCDSGERYLESYYNPQWVASQIGDITPWQAKIAAMVNTQ